MKKSRGRVFVVFATVMMVAVITYFVLNIVYSPYWDSVYTPTGYFSMASMREAENDSEVFTKEQACADIDYLIKRLARVHPMCSDGVPENVRQRAEAEKAGFGSEVTSYDMWRACARVLHEFGDAHTMAGPSFPLTYLKAHNERIDEGYELAAINGESIEDIFARSAELISYELEPWGVNTVEGYATTREGLKFLGMYSDKLDYTYRAADGSEMTVTYTQSDFYNNNAANGDAMPDTPYSSQLLPERSAALLTIDSCVYDMDFREFIYNFFKEVTEEDIGNVIIDLRENSGGTSQIFDEIMIYTDHDKFKTPGGKWRLGPYTMTWEADEQNVTHMDDVTVFGGKIYVLTSHDTYSAGTMVAALMQDNGFAEIVGEECGSMPASYGDVAVFQTPNAAVTFQISTKYFDRVDESRSSEPLTPDVETTKDMALVEALEIIRNS